MSNVLFYYCFLFIFITESVFFANGKLRKGFYKCKLGEAETNECLLTGAKRAIPELIKGIPEFGIPSIEPLDMGNLHLDQSSANLQLVETLTGLKIYGLSKMVIDEVRVEKKVPLIKLKFHVPTPVIMNGTYDLKGKLLVLPLVGKGLNSNILYGFNSTLISYFTPSTSKNGELKWKLKESIIDFGVTNLNVTFENLFNGDKALSDSMNRIINENWNIFYEELKPVFKEAIEKIFIEAMRRFFEHININEAFPS